MFAIVVNVLAFTPWHKLVVAERPALAQKLIQELYVGVDPLQADVDRLPHVDDIDGSMTHVSKRDIKAVLTHTLQPVSFYLELGSFEGGSAIRAAESIKEQADANGPSTTVVAVDTFLGDVRVLWGRTRDQRREMLRPDGTINLYDRFRANVRDSGQADLVIPMPATSIVALRLFTDLASKDVVSPPQVIYLDSAHEEGEVLLEMELAWKLLAPGGILFGDDWVLPTPIEIDPPQEGESQGNGGGEGIFDEGAVQRDVLRFAEAHEAEVDDAFGRNVQPMRTLARVRPGLFVSYISFQWFMRKLPHVTRVTSSYSAAPTVESGFDCWSEGYEKGDCCDVEKFGPGGNIKCWDLMFTFGRCCKGETAISKPSPSKPVPTARESDCWSEGFKQGDCCDVKKFGPKGNEQCWDSVFTFERCCSAAL